MITVARWFTNGTMIPGTLEELPAAPFTLANAAMRGKYAECDTQKKTFEVAPEECRECGTTERVTRGFCARCYVARKM